MLDFVAARLEAGQTRTAPLSRAAIARGADISLGSIGFTLRRLLDSGQLREPEPGRFELA
ncbi:hypothetical protein [Xylophilus sp.]|uniref:hypothetical protein n=1 Tax=Xylophilus sp. TaxID=2653893 RepID=UPI0013BA03D3|nr:hypothetical protein [Xylophilus sp.]KAF1049501.1 MAG: hypothetical protein GAK38_00599 [Xylophilus sp.]